jgi:radical SAM/Cys-rich protein
MQAGQSAQATQLDYRERAITIDPFNLTLSRHDLKLERDQTVTLQINVGLLCNQTCHHCNLDAGPGRKENMDAGTLEQVVNYARRGSFQAIDVTGGAPELNPNIVSLMEILSPLASRIIFRSNLSALNDGKRDHLIDLLRAYHVVIVASLPSLNETQADFQRGQGIFQSSMDALTKLNSIGYGQEGSGLELNLVSNPTGAFLPPSLPIPDGKAVPTGSEEKMGSRF